MFEWVLIKKRFPECQYLFYIANVNFVRVIETFVLDLLVYWINQKHVGLRRCNLFLGFLLQFKGLMLYCKLGTILAHCCNALLLNCFSYNISQFSYSAKKTIMSITHVKFSLLCCHCWWQRFFLLMYSQFCCEIRQLWWNKFIKFITIK